MKMLCDECGKAPPVFTTLRHCKDCGMVLCVHCRLTVNLDRKTGFSEAQCRVCRKEEQS